MKHLKRKDVLPLIFCLLCLGASIAACIAASRARGQTEELHTQSNITASFLSSQAEETDADFPPPGKPPLPPYPYMAGRWPLFIPATQNPS